MDVSVPTKSTPTSTPIATPLSGDELGAWRGFLRSHATLVHELDAELRETHGLPLAHYDVMVNLEAAEAGSLRMRDLADAVLLSRSGLTRLVDRMEADGLIERRDCPSDARGQFAVLTDAGRATLAEARVTHLAGVRRRFLSTFDAEELAWLAGAWDRVPPAG